MYKNIPSVTLVTSCFDTTKYNPGGRSFEDALNGLHILLELPVYLIIHTDKVYIDKIKEIRSQYGFDNITQYIEEEYESLWSAQFTEIVKSNREKYWPTRDARVCAESHLICCNKFSFVKDAILSNPFQTERFGWIDSNLYNAQPGAIKICEDYTPNKIPYVLSQIKDDKFHIQVLNVTNNKFMQKEHKREYYQHYRWVVCGCFFVCSRESGLKILTRLNEVVTETTLAGYGHGEEMFYLEVLNEFPDDIVKSYGDYRQIINNFIFPTKNMRYILNYIIRMYYNYGYYKECRECCEKVLYSYDNFLIPMEEDVYNNVLLMYNEVCSKL